MMKEKTNVRTSNDALASNSLHVAFCFGTVLIFLSTLFRASNRQIPIFALECISLITLAALFGHLWLFNLQAHRPQLNSAEIFNRIIFSTFLSAPIWVSALQLAPWPQTWLPEASIVSHSLAALSSEELRSSSLAPTETWISLLAGLPWVACIALACVATQKQVQVLVRIWIAIGVFQVVFGLMQLAFPALLFTPNSSAPVLGTFGNRNGLANFLAMLLPLMVFFLLPSAQIHRRHSSGKQRGLWLKAGALLLLLAGLTATLSRAGIATGILTVVLALVLLISPSRHPGEHRGPLFWSFGLIALALLALVAGGWEWLARFEADRLASDDVIRALNRSSTWAAVQAFWPMGSGLGTFGVVFPQFAASEMGPYSVNFAHNDYLELLMEAGALVIPPALAVLWLVVRRCSQLVRARRRGWGDSDRLAIACGLGVLAQALHAWVDYPWQIPANAMLGAFMLGVFLRVPDGHVRDSAAP